MKLITYLRVSYLLIPYTQILPLGSNNLSSVAQPDVLEISTCTSLSRELEVSRRGTLDLPIIFDGRETPAIRFATSLGGRGATLEKLACVVGKTNLLRSVLGDPCSIGGVISSSILVGNVVVVLVMLVKSGGDPDVDATNLKL